MLIKLLTIDIHFPDRSSLKEKRFLLSSLKAKLRQKFNVAVCEIDYHDKWQRTMLAIVTVGVDGAAVESTHEKIVRMIESDRRMVVLDSSQEDR